jgi:hypothetical protein
MLGILRLLLSLRRGPLLATGGLFVFAAVTWVNGGVRDWAAGDAFGARRFDLVIPLVVVGLCALLERTKVLLAGHPLLVPAIGLICLALWNLGLIVLYRDLRYPNAAPLERVVGDQVRQSRFALEEQSRRWFGNRVSGLIYKVLVGEYM